MRLLPLSLESEDSAVDVEQSYKFPKKTSNHCGPYGLIFKQTHLKRLVGPGVYIFWRKDKALYIGSGKNALCRMTTDAHPQARMAMEKADWIEIIACGREVDARNLEADFIKRYQPEYNTQGKSGCLSAVRGYS